MVNSASIAFAFPGDLSGLLRKKASLTGFADLSSDGSGVS